MKKMKGFIDPYSLGFLISIIGGTAAYVVHEDANSLPDQSSSKIESSTSEEKSPTDMHNITPGG